MDGGLNRFVFRWSRPGAEEAGLGPDAYLAELSTASEVIERGMKFGKSNDAVNPVQHLSGDSSTLEESAEIKP